MKTNEKHIGNCTLTRIYFYVMNGATTCTTAQEGILVTYDELPYFDGDLFYNESILDNINDETDLESLLTSGDCTTYWHKNFDGSYTIDA